MISISYIKNGQVQSDVEIDGDRVTKGTLPSECLSRFEVTRTPDPEIGITDPTWTLERYMMRVVDSSGNQISLLNGTGWIPTPVRGDAEPEIPDTPDLIIEKLQEDATGTVKKWIKAIASWIDSQGSLESAAQAIKKPAELYSKLGGSQFQVQLYQSFMLADLAGRLDVLEEVDEFTRDDSNLDVFEPSIHEDSRNGLVKKKVTVRGRGGRTYEAIRWVRPEQQDKKKIDFSLDESDRDQGLYRYDAHIDGKNVGYALIEDRGNHWFLESIKTSKEHRKQGIGSSLLNLVIKERGDKPIELMARPYGDKSRALNLEKLVSFYERRGFVQYKENDDGIYMRRKPDSKKSDSLREDAPRPEWLRLSFEEAIAYFRSKVSIPVKSFKKMEEGYHDSAFSITGLTKGALLDDARWLIDKAIADGTSFDTFKKQWNRLIGRKGWEPKGDKNRRLYIIYDTNIRSAYGVGRGQQMTDPDVSASRPYILWRHRDSPNPRVNHQQLDGKAIALSNPFWDKVNPPSGFSCRCGIFSVTKEYCDRNGIEILDNPPDPSTIVESGFSRPLRGMTASDRQEVVSRTLDNLTPETRAIVEKELIGGGD